MKRTILCVVVLLVCVSVAVAAPNWLTPTELLVGDGELIDAVVLPDDATMTVMYSEVNHQTHLRFTYNADYLIETGTIALVRQDEPETVFVILGDNAVHCFVGWPDNFYGVAQVYRYTVDLDEPGTVEMTRMPVVRK